jgi:hypothetical protein
VADAGGVTGIVFPSGGALGPAYDSVALVGDFNVGQLYRLPLNTAAFDLSGVSGLEDLVADARASAIWCGWLRLRRHQRPGARAGRSIYIARRRRRDLPLR